MKRQQKIRIGGARSKTKLQEKTFLKKAEKLKEHPEYLIPKCSESKSFRCPFTKLQKQLDIVYKNRDDPARIEKLAKKGDHIARAYAAMIKIQNDGKIPMFAAAKMPWGEVNYVMRNHITKDKLIGVQNFDDPKVRLLAYADIIKKKGLTIYSFKDKMLCQCSATAQAKPPEEFINFALKVITPKLKKDLSCHHLNLELIRKEQEKENYLEIHWKIADRKLYLCKHCAGKTNTFGEISQYIGSKHVRDHFAIDFHYQLHCLSPTSCGCQNYLDNPAKLKEEYMKSKLSDEGYITKSEEHIRDKISSSNETLYIHGSTCFGKDVSAFLDSFKLDELVRRALEIALKKQAGSVVVMDQSPVQLLKEMWEDAGLDILREFTSDEEEAQKLYQETNADELSPARIIRMARSQKRHAEIEKTLPDYSKLPEKAKFADAIARVYKLHGKDAALREIASRKTDATAALAYAFYLSFNMHEKMGWKFSREQMDYGDFLKKFVDQLLKAEANDYHPALQTVLQAAGSTEEITPVKNP